VLPVPKVELFSMFPVVKVSPKDLKDIVNAQRSNKKDLQLYLYLHKLTIQYIP